MTRAKTDAKLAQSKPAPPVVDKSRSLQMESEPGKTQDRMLSDLLAQGLVSNASAAAMFHKSEYSDVSLTDLLASLKDCGGAVNRGDFSAAERMLTAQAVALNAIFGELARRAAVNMGTYVSTTEAYLRLALKAQSQSRATVETLAAIKNPPVVFARQANIAHGPQQVNNGPAPPKAEQYAPGSARPGETVTPPTELLEGRTHGSTQLDTRATPATSRSHPALEPVGALDRPAHR
jgi:hypothetical protein